MISTAWYFETKFLNPAIWNMKMERLQPKSLSNNDESFFFNDKQTRKNKRHLWIQIASVYLRDIKRKVLEY